MAEKRKLPPMSALEDAIRRAFRNLVFLVLLLLAWGLAIALVAAGPAYLLKDVAAADLAKLPPAKMAMLAGVGLVALLGYLSVMVNWQRRLVSDETPKGWRWWRLDGPVWRYLANLAIFLVIIGIYAGAAAAVFLLLPAHAPQLGPAAQPVTNVVTALLAISALLAWQRLSTKFPAVAAGRRDYGFAQAWRDTRGNTIRFLAFDFWLAFTLAIAGAIGFAAFKGQAVVNNPYALIGALALIAFLALFCVALIFTVPSVFYSYWGESRDFPPAK